jgi:regulator of replication initiation timing
MANEVDTTEELARLRTTLAEILQTKKTLQAKIEALQADYTTLQAENATLKTQVTEATQKVTDATVGVPLRKMAAQLSEFPELWLSEFEKRYTVEADSEGKLAILTKDGKPAKDVNGKPVEFEAHAIWRLLTGGASSYAKNEDGKLFATLTKWHGAVGGGSGSTNRGSGANVPLEPETKKAPKIVTGLGLR